MEALCGTVVRLTTLDGRQLTIPVSEVVGPQTEKVRLGGRRADAWRGFGRGERVGA